MDESFHKSTNLPKDKMWELIQKSNHPALKRFIIMYTLFLVAGIGVVLSWDKSWLAIIFSQLFFGIMCCSFFACEHETIHNTAFKSRSLNRYAAFLVGVGHLYPPTMFRELHFTHHRHTHVPGLDPEISIGNKAIPSVLSNLPTYLGWLTGLPLLSFKCLMLVCGAFGMPEIIRKRLFPWFNPKFRVLLALESIIIIGVHVGIATLALYVHHGFWGLFVGQLVGHCLLASYTSPEHNGLPHEGNILEKTRSMHASKLVKLLMWNMPYHAEHHAYPAIPFHALPNTHEAILDELKHKDLSYPDFHLWVLKKTTIGDK